MNVYMEYNLMYHNKIDTSSKKKDFVVYWQMEKYNLLAKKEKEKKEKGETFLTI